MIDEREEIGYPHELILSSLQWAEKVLDERYSKKTKLLALAVLSIIGKKQAKKVNFKIENDVYLEVLYYALKGGRSKLELGIKQYREELHRLIDQYKDRRSITALEEAEEFIRKSIFLHILLEFNNKKELLREEDIQEIISNIKSESLRGLLESIALLKKGKWNESELRKNLDSYVSIGEQTDALYGMFLSFNLGIKSENLKGSFLFEHYRLLKYSIRKYVNIPSPNSKKLDDTYLNELFEASVLLFFCGYKSSLRIPREEKINYLEYLIAKNTLSNEFKKAFSKHAVLEVRGLKIPLWTALVMDASLILLSILFPLTFKGSIGIDPFSIPLPFPIPLFPALALLLAFFILLKIYRLENLIEKELVIGD